MVINLNFVNANGTAAQIALLGEANTEAGKGNIELLVLIII
jgi:hypothetical protein